MSSDGDNWETPAKAFNKLVPLPTKRLDDPFATEVDVDELSAKHLPCSKLNYYDMADRRKALSAIGTAFLGGLGGCISDLLPGSDDTVDDSPVLKKTIREGNYYLTNTTGPDHVEYTVEVIEGPRVDVLLIDRNGLNAIQNENFENFTYYENMSSTHTLFAEASGELKGDLFGLVVDNSDNVGASPAGPGEAVVNIDTKLIFRH